MGKKKLYGSGIVYSTDPNLKIESGDEGEASTLPAKEQLLIVRLDARNRGGKVVTLVEGFKGKAEDAEALGKRLKSHCGTGGSVKNNEILIQGDNKQKAFQWLMANGYVKSKIK